jgi:site-specific recombinase XerD
MEQSSQENSPSEYRKDQWDHLQSAFFKGLQNSGKSDNTLKNYQTDLTCFNQFLEKSNMARELAKFEMDHIKAYGDYLQERYSSDNSRRRRVQTLRIFFDFLVEQRVFPSNPVRKIPASPKFLDIPRPASLIDIKTLWVYLIEESKTTTGMDAILSRRNQVITLLIFGGGLKVSDLQHISHQSLTLGDRPHVMVTPKRRDPYTIELPKIFTEVYENYYQLLEQAKQSQGIEFDHILFNANPYKILSGGLSSRGLEMIFEDLRKKLLIQVTPKSLRQACIFNWLHQKIPDGVIKEWLGLAPSYSLKLYKEHMFKHIYSDEFIAELYQNYSGGQAKI